MIVTTNKIIIKGISKKSGFTLMETLVAVAILMISIAGPLVIAQKSLYASMYARDQVIATFLAQEALENLKNYRDNNGFDALNTTPIDTSCNSCSIAGVASKFSRRTAITVIGTSQQSTVTVTVSWSSGTLVNTTVIQDTLFDVLL